MGSCKQQRLSWIIILISAAAVCISCQQQGITSTLHEGNHTCPGEVVIFTCTLRGSLALAWRSPGYIANGNPLQFSTASMLGVAVPSRINGRVTATATLTNNALDNGEQVLMSTLRIAAVETSVVTCSGTNGDTLSIEFFISAVPGIPRRIDAAEISRPRDDICIILVTWDPPANNDASDIGQYIVYVPSRINVSTSSTISTLTVSNCGDDTHIQVAAVNHIGCVGMKSSEVQLTLLDIPTAATDDESVTTSNQLSTSAVAGIIGGAVILFILMIVLVLAVVLCNITWKVKNFERKFDKETKATSKPSDGGEHQEVDKWLNEMSPGQAKEFLLEVIKKLREKVASEAKGTKEATDHGATRKDCSSKLSSAKKPKQEDKAFLLESLT